MLREIEQSSGKRVKVVFFLMFFNFFKMKSSDDGRDEFHVSLDHCQGFSIPDGG